MAILCACGPVPAAAAPIGPVASWRAQDLPGPAAGEPQDLCAGVPRPLPASAPAADGDQAVADLAGGAGRTGEAAAGDPPVAAAPAPPAPPATPDFFQSRGLPVAHTSYDAEWRIARDTMLSLPCAEATSGVQPPVLSVAQIATVNAAVNRAVRYVDDETLTGLGDDWATADRTLRRGAGDCEDIAILKMQLLAALGVPERELYLSIVRDLVRAKDHAVLVVALGGRTWLLDSNTDQVLDAGDANSYAPVITLSGDYRWLHGGPLPQLSAPSSPRSGP